MSGWRGVVRGTCRLWPLMLPNGAPRWPCMLSPPLLSLSLFLSLFLSLCLSLSVSFSLRLSLCLILSLRLSLSESLSQSLSLCLSPHPLSSSLSLARALSRMREQLLAREGTCNHLQESSCNYLQERVLQLLCPCVCIHAINLNVYRCVCIQSINSSMPSSSYATAYECYGA